LTLSIVSAESRIMAAFYLMRATPLGCAGVRECILTTNAASGRRGV
jgi:hypothetical protein